MRDVFIGVELGLVTCLILSLLPLELARGAPANLLTLIPAIYVGFALAPECRLSLARQGADRIFLRCTCTTGFVISGGVWLQAWRCRVAGIACITMKRGVMG